MAVKQTYMEEIMKKRGGYPGNLKRELKVRVSEKMFAEVDGISEEIQFTKAWIVRNFISSALEQRRKKKEASCEKPVL
jgi:hypothetical protein